MSVNVDATGMGDESIDYSEYEYETVSLEGFASGTGPLDDAEVNVDFKGEWEPLSELGGLDSNEVAEIVFIELVANVEWEDESAEQTQSTAAEMRGSLGANLERNDLHFHGPNNADVEVTAETNGSGGDVGSSVYNRDEIFLQFNSYGTAPFDTLTDGAGGGGTQNSVLFQRNFRELTGRGPVIDAADNMTAVWRVIAGNSVIQVGGTIRAHIVYDTATVDDAGRRFAVPSDD